MNDVTIRRWQDHTVWLDVHRAEADATECVSAELAAARTGTTVLVDLTESGPVDAAFAKSLRDAVEAGTQRGVHVIVAASDLDARLALVGVDLDHLAPMPQSRLDAMAFLSTVIAQAS